MRNQLRGASAAILASALFAASAHAQDAPPRGDGLEDIVVTAQRSDQRLQDVPVAVSAVSSETIERLAVTGPQDLNRLAPNVKFDGVTGGTAGLKPFIRGGGITDGAFVTAESEVAIYVDDVYRARLSASLLDFMELERIEVLRGPQGVLYGRNSSAGAVNFITKGPAATFKGNVEAGFGSWNERRLRVYASTPLSEDGKWRGSVNAMIRGRDGGRQFNATLNKKVGKEDFAGVQADVAYVGDAVEGRLTGFYMNGDTDGQYAVATQVDAAGKIVPVSGSYRRVQSPIASFTKVEQYGGTLRLSADMPNGRITSISAYSELNDSWRQDFSGGVPPSALGLPGTTPLALFDRTLVGTQRQFSQELQVSGGTSSDFLQYLGGLYYFHEAGQQDIDSVIFFVPSNTIFSIKTNSFAGFGQLTFNLSDRLALIAGGRYTIDDKQLNARIGGTPVDLKNSYQKFTPKLGINYKITQDILAYASYSEGFKGGGYNGLAGSAAQLSLPFRPQVTEACEVGFKSDLFGRRARINVAAFYNKIKDRQQPVNTNDGAFLVENYDMTIKGVEAELSIRAASWLTLWANGSLNDGKYDASSAGGSLTNNDPPSLPDYQFSVGFDGDVPAGPGKLIFGADYNDRGSYFSTPENAAIGFIPQQDFLAGYLGYEWGQWKLQVNGKNLLNREGWQTGFGFAVVQPRFSIEPRTVLATLRYKF
ncbi:iron complex outermembrane receptor protein [Sphingomonas zeicaulis]|uniref:TonB-dependent receptor n=1 Tax=Sphingomonas zeicaulis TaxID=1632740 RepID=UPI003D21E175